VARFSLSHNYRQCTQVKISFIQLSMSDSGINHIPPANATGDGAAIVAAVNQLPLAHQNSVVVCLLAGVADPDLSAVPARHLVFVSVHYLYIK
jgi:hypothetical protein